ncbi:hypothetical protein COY65_00055 [Candidatus Jorgensenbacteria bacterium CG_4_10_14_0_8_um_filter_39_13]|uniref:Uncharacterized protein n=2 Tax=Candidatus Joergenseniibacteriota TaxID=1752739 RepID=A0A2M7RIR5_9BACT|nr:MAG: hypothetical protein COV54_02470 [Candidatus Jorgensenbacteria bacterium CG11_big_fil_rev_8_21_14_0_20_38_23]PIV13155.1 MAG: hypothetical protein COS46_01680 [Candidatus Jorgensenbacteria bacterium CG03_land_8_20_14_0_80_38_39]PIW97860.1 MAG: hypothetical protein COZ81_00360 [Candidatus Jorgensenbacteria bacterium CG_4_8_14_3_um_filter_38_10]PIY96604.1 MAG: hypothetical protein COY65_00055 [Candidatus Jorgensenbacteria bacterium CG_4_10_14_0_8_um_filter_39_13]
MEPIKLEEEIGLRRESRVDKILRQLQDKGVIRGFVKSSKRDSTDRQGIDFVVVKVGRTFYEVFPVQVTGRNWVKNHKEKHPQVPIVVVEYSISDEQIQKEIVEILTLRS